MADPLFELLAPHFESTSPSPRPRPSIDDPSTSTYLTHLSTLKLSSLSSTEPQSLAQAAHSSLLSLQALSTRSHKSIISSSDHLSTLCNTLPTLAQEANALQDAVPKLDQEAERFARAYGKTAENPLLDRRRKAMVLSRNVDRLSDILDLPSLISSAISASSTASGTSGTSVTSSSQTSATPAVNYASALDLDGHIKRLHTLYPNSPLIASVSAQAEQAMREMTSNLINSLRTPGIKLAGGMRTIGWIRRVAPELDETRRFGGSSGHDGSLGALFLVCRLSNLVSMLDALEPLRDLADIESKRRMQDTSKRKEASSQAWSGGQQTERYLKRYIEIFREQSFAIISMYRSIFPSSTLSLQDGQATKSPQGSDNALQAIPSALPTFPLHLVDMLASTLQAYLPNVQDKAARESLLTQVLYCAGSLGRLGGDFSMLLASLGDEEGDSEDESGDGTEWVEVMKKHRVLAGRLELLASGVGGSHGISEAASRKSSQ